VNGLSATEATARYTAATSRRFQLIGSLVGGETGATAIQEAGGDRLVLKWDSDPRNISRRLEAIALTERLRTRRTGRYLDNTRWNTTDGSSSHKSSCAARP
jgi:hypothetical protein